MHLLTLPLLLAGLFSAPVQAAVDPHQHHHHHHQDQELPRQPDRQHQHGHALGPAGATYDLRWLDAMTVHHTGALRMSELVFGIGSPGVGALGQAIWREQAREIRAMGLWRRAWYPDAPVYPVVLAAGGDPDSMAALERMSDAQIAAMAMVGTLPTREGRVTWFLEGMLAHHGGALEMAHDALEKSTNPRLRRLAREIIVAQRREIIQLRRMLALAGLEKPEYHRYDRLFSLP